MIIDYSFWRPNPATDLKGVNGAITYISHDTEKCTTAEHLAALHHAGIATALVFEDAAARMTDGGGAGRADGEFVAQWCAINHVPPGRTVYVAGDFDIEDYAPGSADSRMKLGPVGDYQAGFNAAASGYGGAVYGGYWLVSRMISAGLANRAWQTTAWSAGRWDHRCALFQLGVQLYGGNADLNAAGHRDWGQWRRQAIPATTATLFGREA
jgi:Rv2525c-like, glycoside hydrolase-like domain